MSDDTLDEVVNVLREIRHANGYTQDDVAVRMGVSQAVISDIERRRTSTLTVDTLERYAEACGAVFSFTATCSMVASSTPTHK